jgi:exonuclease III
MRILFWNIRGIRAYGRRDQLREIIQKHRVEVICLQETIKADFTQGELASLSEGRCFEWVWTAAQGHSGGTLLGIQTNDITVVEKDMVAFFTSMNIVSRKDKFQWEIINVYGPVQNERKLEFLSELSQKIASMTDPFIIGGDFNMIRFEWEKSSDNVNHTWRDAFTTLLGITGSRS